MLKSGDFISFSSSEERELLLDLLFHLGINHFNYIGKDCTIRELSTTMNSFNKESKRLWGVKIRHDEEGRLGFWNCDGVTDYDANGRDVNDDLDVLDTKRTKSILEYMGGDYYVL